MTGKKTAKRIGKLLIANRGEIARRIERTCGELGIATVVVYSDTDAGEPFVTAADEAVRLPGDSPADTYLRGDAIIEGARLTGADAIHPGYGFLSENADFAAACRRAGLTFVGPPAEAIAAMGSKIESKRIMREAGVRVLDAIDVATKRGAELLAAADEIGYPVLVKAAAGGGGKGMRIVDDPADLEEAAASARREAAAAFGDDAVFLERYLRGTRHIEFQILGDAHGTVSHLFERECSIQRRHQKIIEETPSPAIDDALRDRMGAAAIAAARAVGYEGAGTVEFLLDGDEYYFLEMNTRLQVEHPVTEMVTGLDLVALQIHLAEGEPMPERVMNAAVNGHSIEARLYAEDPANGFLPISGTLHRFSVPETVRTDAGPGDGSEISVHYDPMLAKVIAHAPTRDEAAAKLSDALATAQIYGPRTNRELLVRVLRSVEFLSGETNTDFLDQFDMAQLSSPLNDDHRLHALAAAMSAQEERRRRAVVLETIPSGWRNAPSQLNIQEWDSPSGVIRIGYRFDRDGLIVEIDGSPVTTELHSAAPDQIDLTAAGIRRRYHVYGAGRRTWVSSSLGQSELVEVGRFPAPKTPDAPGSLLSAMPGKVVTVLAAKGATVARGETLVIIEAMKMEHAVKSPSDGVVTSIPVSVGQQVEADQVLAVVEAAGADE